MRRLVALPFTKSCRMAYQSIRVRFFRSLVTTMSLVLAVAFLSFTRAGNDIAGGLLATGSPQAIERVAQAGYDLQPGAGGVAGSSKQRWIIFLSLLVCIVGIINAQLMSVTERFREIGTLKCLGALDRFIVRIFVIEAAIQGVVGSFAGALLGALAAIVTALVKFGWPTTGLLPWADIGVTVLTAMVTGTALSLVGVLYPAIVASRMQPVEAMRVEQ